MMTKKQVGALEAAIDYLKDVLDAGGEHVEFAAIPNACRRIKTVVDAAPALIAELRRLQAMEFWSKFVYPEGATAEEVQAELNDYHTILNNVSKVYCEITNGRVSKPNTLASSVLSEANAYTQEQIDAETKRLQRIEAAARELSTDMVDMFMPETMPPDDVQNSYTKLSIALDAALNER